LAIELVATRATFASPGQLLSELDQHMLEFSGDWRDMPERHHTLGAAIEWSYRGLNAEQRELYAGLAVFAGWFSLDAVKAIFGPASSDALCALVDQSLVVHRWGDAPASYRLLTPIREDAHRRLQASGDEARLRQQHAAYHLEWAEHTAARLKGPELIGAIDEIAGAIDNLHAALEWAIDEAADDALGLRLAIALWWFWHIRSHLGEGRHWLSRALERGKHAPPALRGRALTGLAVLTWYQGDLDLASQIIAAGVHALRAPDSDDSWRDLGIALSAASMIASFRSDPASALSASAECATIAHRLGDTWLQSLNSNAKGRATWLTRDLAAARKEFEAGTALGRAMNDPWLTSLPLGNLGAVLIEMGDPTGARLCLEESLALCEQIGERWLRGMALQLLGQIAQQAGELRKSTALYLEALRLSRELSLRIGVIAALNGLSRVAQIQGDYERSARLQAEQQAVLSER
jgi:tetratricopeptide (TPR) repeat protein